VGKARAVNSREEGAVLTARVDLGTALYVTTEHVPTAVQTYLGIREWRDLDDAKLALAGCDSVYAKAGGHDQPVSRDELCVRENSQISPPRLVDAAKPQNNDLVSVPFWQWPDWVLSMAQAVAVDHNAIDAAADRAAQGAANSRTVVSQSGAVKFNAAGRPIHDNGRFMSFAEARRLGWAGGGVTATGTAAHVPRQRRSRARAAAARAGTITSARWAARATRESRSVPRIPAAAAAAQPRQPRVASLARRATASAAARPGLPKPTAHPTCDMRPIGGSKTLVHSHDLRFAWRVSCEEPS
jgi:hypothetical protein